MNGNPALLRPMRLTGNPQCENCGEVTEIVRRETYRFMATYRTEGVTEGEGTPHEFVGFEVRSHRRALLESDESEFACASCMGKVTLNQCVESAERSSGEPPQAIRLQTDIGVRR